MAGINRTTGKATDLITFSRASGGTYLDSDGLLKTASTNIPRIEYDAAGNVKGLLIEEARTNLLTYSDDFTNASWASVETSVTANQTTSPDGQTGADLVVPSTNNVSNHLVRQSATAGASRHTLSVYAKSAGYNWLALSHVDGDGITHTAFFDINNGVIGTVSGTATAQIEGVGSGWYRCSVTPNSAATTSSAKNQFVYVAEGDNDLLFAGDGTSGIYVYGAQLEAGSFPTSYIPTSGATATRAADIASISVNNFGYNQKAGTVVVECLSNSGEFGERAISLSDGTSTNQNWLQISGGGSFVGNVYTSGAYVAQLDNTTSTVDGFTAALAFKDNSFGLSVNGVSALSDSAGDIAVYSDLHIGRRHDGLSSTVFNGHIKSVAYYPRRLSNAQLQALTA